MPSDGPECPDRDEDEGVKTWVDECSVSRVCPLRDHVKGRYEVRVVVHLVYELRPHGKIFPQHTTTRPHTPFHHMQY